MAHPYAQHNEHKKSHSRVAHIMKSGGVAKHSDEAADRKLISKMLAEHETTETKAEGKKAPGRFARGGKVKHKGGHKTNVTIVMPKGDAAPPPDMPAPPIAPDAGMPPGGPPMPMRAKGGKVIGGDASKGNLESWGNRASKNSYARGGRLPTAGAMTGVGRLQKAGK